VVNQGAARGSIAAYGNITTQTAGVIRKMQLALEAQGWSLGDIVMMRVYMAPDPSFGFGMNFRGFMEGYTQFFGTANQPNLPARSVVQVSRLVAAGWLVEIDAMAARVPKGE
jgi:enamine deaminase RidA (YjgF/YER057c/UK114 family)